MTARKPAILGHWDSFSAGPIPCRVVAVRETAHGLRFDIRLTAGRGVYRRGETMRHVEPRAVIPRGFLRRSRQRQGHYCIWAHDWRDILAKYGVQPVSESSTSTRESAR